MADYEKLKSALDDVMKFCDSTDCSICPMDEICYDTLIGDIVLYRVVRRARQHIEDVEDD